MGCFSFFKAFMDNLWLTDVAFLIEHEMKVEAANEQTSAFDVRKLTKLNGRHTSHFCLHLVAEVFQASSAKCFWLV